jgi:hypothetical protein
MTRDEYFYYRYNYTLGDNWTDAIDSFNRVTDLAHSLVVINRKKLTSQNEIQRSAQLLFHLTATRSVSIKKLYKKIEDKNQFTGAINLPSIDPFSIFTLARSQFEALCIFNNIFIHHSGEQQAFLYYVWVISGLQYRQSFNLEIPSEELLKTKPKETQEFYKNLQVKIANEAKDLQEYFNKLYSLGVYKGLDPDNEKFFAKQILKRKDIQIKFTAANKIEKQSWKQLYQQAAIKPAFDQIYSFLSLAAHPSYVSVFQLNNVVNNNGDDFFRNSVNSSRYLLCMLIRDYLTVFPELKDEYLKMDTIGQMVVDSVNTTYRGEDYQISDILLRLLNESK